MSNSFLLGNQQSSSSSGTVGSSPVLSSSPSTAPTAMTQAYPPYQQPPQLAYGWWVDVLPPRGPYLWPCLPDTYALTPAVAPKSINDPTKLDESVIDQTTENGASSAAPGTDGRPSFLTQAPQMAFGWYIPHPPQQPPYFWSCLPPGFTLTPVSAVRTTRQGNVTLTLPAQSIDAQFPPSNQSWNPTKNSSNSYLSEHDTTPSLGPSRSPALEGLANVAAGGNVPGMFSLSHDDPLSAEGENKRRKTSTGGTQHK